MISCNKEGIATGRCPIATPMKRLRIEALCQGIRDGGGAYPLAVKANQPNLMADLVAALSDGFPRGTDQGSGRSSRARP